MDKNNPTYNITKIKALLWKCTWKTKNSLPKQILNMSLTIPLFVLLFLIRSNISVSKSTELLDYNSDPMAILELTSDIEGVFYTCNNSMFINELMVAVSQKLNLHYDSVIGYNNEADLLQTQFDTLLNNNKYFAVIFENYEDESPKRLNYTLRSSENYKTSRTKPNIIIPGPHEQYGLVYERFSLLQFTLDTSFIAVKSGKNITQSLLLQSFPYPFYNKDGDSIKFSVLLPFVTINSYLFFVIYIIGDLMNEKKSGIKELMVMMGMKRRFIWFVNYLYYLVPQIIAVTIITCLLNLGTCALIPKSSFLIIWFSLLLYVHYQIAFSCMISTFFIESLLASLCVMVIWIVSQLATLLYISVNKQWTVYFYLIFPNTPLIWMYQLISFFELQDIGLTNETIHIVPTIFPMSYIGIWVLLFINSLIYLLVVYFKEQPNPLSVKHFWKSKLNENNPMELLERLLNNVAIQINNVGKVYNSERGFKKRALNNITLNIYKNSITTLLGHNGAGKTTLLSIITGMLSPTHGNIYIDGMDVMLKRDRVLNRVGICPQTNIVFPELTVEQNIMFFAMAKGYNFAKAREETVKIMERLNLLDKRNDYCCDLSGGTKRRLQLAMALAGGSSIIILDEPTTGLDPRNRREIWDILLELRKDRTILLSTHFMEEADVLGDYVGILQDGDLKCYDTPTYLKNIYCPGYKLTLLKIDKNISDTIILEMLDKTSITYRKLWDDRYELKILTSDTKEIKKFFEDYEQRLMDIGVSCKGLSSHSIEDIFLSFYSKSDNDKTCDQSENKNEIDLKLKEKIYRNAEIFFALLKKKLTFYKYKKYLWIPQGILLIGFILMSMYLVSKSQTAGINKKIKLDSGIYDTKQDVMYSMDDDISANFTLDNTIHIEKVNFVNVKNMSVYDAVLNIGKTDISRYHSDLFMALSLKNNEIIGLYSISVYHTLPVVVNLITNIMAAEYLGANDTNHIDVYNEPIIKDSLVNTIDISSRSTEMMIISGLLISLGWNVFMTIFLTYAVYETENGARDLIIMTGLSKKLYWFTHYLHDLLWCIVAMIIMCLIILLDPLETYTIDALCPFVIAMILNLVACLSFIYSLSYFWKDYSSCLVYFFIGSIVSCMMAMMKYTHIIINDGKGIINFVTITECIVPIINLNTLFINTIHMSQERVICERLNQKQSQTNFSTVESSCCGHDDVTGECYPPMDFYRDSNYGIFYNIVKSCIAIFIFMAIMLIMEYNIPKIYLDRLMAKRVQIKAESQHGDNKGKSNILLKIEKMSKDYYKNYVLPSRGIIKAVQNLDMSIDPGQCVGLAGLNGAGKTSVFKLLTGFETPTYGSISIRGNTLKKNRNKYLSSISYCPQFDAVSDYLTSKEVLTFFACLKGVPKEVRDSVVKKALEDFGLSEYENLPSSTYSGGYKRSLSLAVAMVDHEFSNEKVLLLDEPTSGVDPISRKRLHKTIENAVKGGNSAILSSHSMSECNMCSQVGIMIDGQLKHNDIFKNSEGKGITLIITIKINVTKLDALDVISKFKDSMKNIPDITLKEELQSNILLQYTLERYSILYGKIFNEMEKMRDRYNDLIEYYNISESTLDDIFLKYVNDNKSSEDANQID